jgi:hypothetical protein
MNIVTPKEVHDLAKDFADWIDSNVLLNFIKQTDYVFKENEPLIGRYFYNSSTEKIEVCGDK